MKSTYDSIFRKYAAEFDLDWLILKAVAWKESELIANAKGASGERGLMQITSVAADSVGVSYGLMFSPEYNIKAGAMYLSSLFKKFGSMKKALCAYNWGPSNLSRVVNEFPITWWRYIPNRNYVNSVSYIYRSLGGLDYSCLPRFILEPSTKKKAMFGFWTVFIVGLVGWNLWFQSKRR